MQLSLILILFITVQRSAAQLQCEDSKEKFAIKLGSRAWNRRCNWVAKKPSSRCRNEIVGGTPIEDICPVTCGKCHVEQPEIARELAGSGCCTLNYKTCITWCGSTEDSCLSCSNSDVGWIPNGAPSGSCAARWSGCGHAKNSCCDGLTCQANADGWFACLPGESTPTPPNPTNPPVSPTMAPVQPTNAPTNAPQPNPTNAPVLLPTMAPVAPTVAPVPISTNPPTNPPTNAPQPNPTNPPVTLPTAAPVAPTTAPVSIPTTAPNANGCCSLDYKNCVSWCGSTYDSCMTCGNNEVVWLPEGPGDTCGERWSGCGQNNSGCCNGLTCQWRDGHDYFACLPGGDGTPTSPNPPQPNPTNPPVGQPTTAPVVQPTIAPAPTTPFSGTLLSTDKAMNAWEVYQGLDYITHKNSENPPNYALVASGGAAGGGNLVVSESQAYGLLITGTVLASWDTHAGQVPGANRNEVLKSFEGYYNFWKEMCMNSSGKSSNCQSGGNYCKSGSNSYVCLPDWRHYKTGGSESTGPAPDADEDAIVGIILAVKAVENDANKPSWYDEARKWADASASAFYDFEVDKSRGEYRLVKLGSCWGGWDGAGNNPSYHSPGSFRVMKDYQNSFPDSDRAGYSAVSQSDWQRLIDTSHEVMRVVQCSNDGALVPNWATIGISGGNLVHTGGGFSGSGTPQYEYGAEAARTTFRVALDAAFYPEKSAEWSPYLSQFNYRMDQGFSNGSISSNSFPSCRTPGTNQNINMFGDWQNNAFIFGPTYSALIGASSDIANAEAMIDSVGQKLNSALPGSYYPRSWAMISNLMLNGAMESAGNTLKQ